MHGVQNKVSIMDTFDVGRSEHHEKDSNSPLDRGQYRCRPFACISGNPVIDAENIAQQLKTYLESVKLVTNTAEQIRLQLQELTSLPTKLLEKYKNEVMASIEKVKDHAKPTGILSEEGMWQKVWNERFPVIAVGDLSQTAMSERNVEITMQALQSLQNQKDITAYHNLMKELQESQKRLQELLDLNKSPEGAKQAAQIANEIAVEKAHIDTIKTSIQAISVQNEVMESQRQIVKEQNEHAVAQAMANATEATIKQMHKEAAAIQGMPIGQDNPWAKVRQNSWW